MRRRAAEAVDTAAHEYRTILDFTPESVEKVEAILSQIHERHRLAPLPRSDLVKASLKWGAYIGEVIRTARPARWALDSEGNGPGSLPIVYGPGDESFPILWCHKRITNGDEDNVWHKFTMLVIERDNPGDPESHPK